MRLKTGRGGPAEPAAESAGDGGNTAAKRAADDDGGVVEKRTKAQNPHVYFDISIGGEVILFFVLVCHCTSAVSKSLRWTKRLTYEVRAVGGVRHARVVQLAICVGVFSAACTADLFPVNHVSLQAKPLGG